MVSRHYAVAPVPPGSLVRRPAATFGSDSTRHRNGRAERHGGGGATGPAQGFTLRARYLSLGLMTTSPFTTAVSEQIWDSRYRFRESDRVRDRRVEDTWRRVAGTLADVETRDRHGWARRFRELLDDFRFLPGGRILAGAGTGRDVTLFNCFVMGRVGDSMDAIFDALKEGAVTMQQGGGVGYDFSTLRPLGSSAWRIGGEASGPVSFMQVWNSMCETLLSTAMRRGAMMGTLRCDHPDIERFIDAKREAGRLTNFNLSVLISDDFMQAVETGSDWALVFPVAGLSAVDRQRYPEQLQRSWSGRRTPEPCLVFRRVDARALWDRILRSAYETAEPGVLFIDRINTMNNLAYRERIAATNPCGEIPLPYYGACVLGSINLTRFVHEPFSPAARLDLDALAATASVAVRMLNNVIDASRFPLPAQREQARGSRRIGLGITGLADSLILLGLDYASAAGRAQAASAMQTITVSAYRASAALARDKGAFPFFEADAYLDTPFVRNLPEDVRASIRDSGIRNSHLIAIAPTGTISLFANNVSSGIEPVFDFEYRRVVRGARGDTESFLLQDYALRAWRARFGQAPLPATFRDAAAIAPEAHLAMQAALQPWVDNAISKTVNVPENLDFESFESIYQRAWQLGLKGCTAYRPNPLRGAVLSRGTIEAAEGQCCGLDREMD